MNIKLILQKFLKGIIFGAGSALFTIDLSSFALTSADGYHKLGIVSFFAIIAGALHGLWEVGRQYFLPLQ